MTGAVNAAAPTAGVTSARQPWLAWLALAFVIAAAALLRLPGVDWHIGAADEADFSFHPDVKRFVVAAQDFKVHPQDGYVQGLSTQLFLLGAAAKQFAGEVNYLKLLRGITQFYAALTLLVTYALARHFGLTPWRSVFAAALLAVAPLHVVNSNFGTPDVAAIFYFYVTLLAAARYLRGRQQGWFLATVVLAGMAVAMKFFIPLFVPLAMVLLLHRGAAFWQQFFTAGFVFLGSFCITSFFNYNPWDFWQLYWMLRADNLVIVGGSTHLEQVVSYSLGMVTALGIPLAMLMLIGVLRWLAVGLKPWILQIASRLRIGDLRSLITPNNLMLGALGAHAFLILSAQVHGERHLLIFLPVACVLAADTAARLRGLRNGALAAELVLAALLLGYGGYNANAIERLFAGDLRNELATWTDARRAEGKPVTAISIYSAVRGADYKPEADPADLPADGYLITCDLEFQRYFGQDDPSQVFHSAGAATHNYYRAALGGTGPTGIVHEFRQRPLSLEQRLTSAAWIPELEAFVPQACFAVASLATSGRTSFIVPAVPIANRASW